MGTKRSTNGEAFNLLKQIGLNQYESRIYVALLSSGSSTAGYLSELSNVPRSRVYDVLTTLENKGFAIMQIGRPVKYVAVPTEIALSKVKASYESDCSKKIDFVSKLEKNLNSALSPLLEKKKKSEGTEEIIGVLKGKNNLYGHIRHMISNSEKSILKVTNEYGLSNLEKHCKPAFGRAKKKGVQIKILANMQSAENAGKISSYAQIRLHKGIDGRFLVSDGKEAVLITHPEDRGLWIKSDYLAGYLEKLFEHAWEKGKVLSG